MLRGDLWWADLGPPRGSAPALRRPVLVISADQYNRSDLPTIMVAVITTNQKLAALPGNVSLAADITGLEVASVVNVTQTLSAKQMPPVGARRGAAGLRPSARARYRGCLPPSLQAVTVLRSPRSTTICSVPASLPLGL